MGLLGKPREPERSRDIAATLRASTGAAGDVEGAISQVVADEYGKRKRYEHEDIVMSNEYIVMIKHIDDTLKMLRDRLDATVEAAESLKTVLQERVSILTRRVDHEKTVIDAYRIEFVGIHARVTEAIDVRETPVVVSGNGNVDVRNNDRVGKGQKPQDDKS